VILAGNVFVHELGRNHLDPADVLHQFFGVNGHGNTLLIRIADFGFRIADLKS